MQPPSEAWTRQHELSGGSEAYAHREKKLNATAARKELVSSQLRGPKIAAQAANASSGPQAPTAVGRIEL